MKFGCLKHINSTDPELHQRFVESARAKINAHVMNQIARFDGSVLLATAAPDVYIPWIWNGDYVATKTKDNPEMYEIRGTAKVSAVMEYSRQQGLMPTVVVTDHRDDIPLMLIDGVSVYLVKQ